MQCSIYFFMLHLLLQFSNMEATWKAGLFGKHESRQLRRIENHPLVRRLFLFHFFIHTEFSS